MSDKRPDAWYRQQRDHRICFYVNSDEKELLESIAKQLRLTVPELLREEIAQMKADGVEGVRQRRYPQTCAGQGLAMSTKVRGVSR